MRSLATGARGARVDGSAARAEDAGASAAPNTTTVTAPPPAPADAARGLAAAAASVVLPSDSPRAYDDLGTLLLEVPGVMVVRTGSTMEFATLRAARLEPRRGPDLRRRGSAQHRGGRRRRHLDAAPRRRRAGRGLPGHDAARLRRVGAGRRRVDHHPDAGRRRAPRRAPPSARSGRCSATSRAGGALGRLRLYLGAHVYSSQGDYPYLYQPAAGVSRRRRCAPRANNDAAARGTACCGGSHAERAPDVDPGRDRVRPRTGAAGDWSSPTMSRPRVSQRARARVPALRVARRSRPGRTGCRPRPSSASSAIG